MKINGYDIGLQNLYLKNVHNLSLKKGSHTYGNVSVKPFLNFKCDLCEL